MAHEVFISYASEDESIGDAICAGLERDGVRCWIASRDLLPGVSYAYSIIAALRSSKALVLVLSASANNSPQVLREVEWAWRAGIPIICVRIEDVAPTGDLARFVSERQWLDAFTPPLERHLARLSHVVREVLDAPQPSKQHDWVRAGLEQRLADLAEEHEAVVRQLGYELNAADGIKLRRQLHALQAEIAAVEQELKAPRITPAGRSVETKVQARALDAALPRRVTVGRPTELVAQVRLLTSAGLKAILKVDHSYQARGRDVVSRSFEVEFPVIADDKLGAGMLMLKVEAPDFEVSAASKKLPIPPEGDSQVVRFLLTPKREGRLEVYLEVYSGDVIAASQAFMTESGAAEAPSPAESASYVILSLPLVTYSWSQPSVSGIPVGIPSDGSSSWPSPHPEPDRWGAFWLTLVLLLCVGLGGIVSYQLASRGIALFPMAASASDLKIAVLAPLSGAVPTFGAMARDGALLAINEWNAKGGVLGKKVTPIVEDSQCSPDPAVNAANKVINQDKVEFIVGDVCSRASIPVSEIANARKVLQISPASTNTNVTVNGDGTTKGYIFRACFIDPFQGRIGAKFAMDSLKAKTAFILLDPANDYSRGLAGEFETAFIAAGGQIAGKGTYRATDTDFSAILAQVAQAKPDVIYLPDYYNIVNLVTRQARDQSISATFLGGDGWDSADLDWHAAVGGYFTSQYAPDSTLPANLAFRKAFSATYKGVVPDASAALAYDATNLLLTAISKAGTDNTDKVKIVMERITFQGVTGTITFDEQHNPMKSAAIQKVTADKIVFESVVAP